MPGNWIQIAALILLVFARPLTAETESERLAAEFEAIQEMERAVEARYRQLVESGSGTDSLMRRLRLNDQGDWLATYLKDSPIPQFQAAYDELNNRKLDYFIDLYLQFAREHLPRLQEKAEGRDRERLAQLVARMEEARETYRENKAQFGKPRDRDRIDAYRAFFASFDQFTQVGSRPYQTGGDRVHAMVALLGRAAHWAKVAVATLLSGLPTAAALVARQDPVAASNGLFQAYFGSQGYRFETQGRENLPRSTPRGTLNIFLLNHTDTPLDVAAISELRLEKGVTMAAGKEFLPEAVVKALSSNPHLLMVGEEANPVERLKELVESGRINSLAMFPEASLTSGVGFETRPTQRSFATFLKLLQRAGIRLNLIPVTSTGNYSLLGRPGERPTVRTVIHRPITPEAVERVMEHGDAKLLAAIVRQHWLDALAAAGGAEGRILGAPPVARLRDDLQARFRDRPACDRMFADMASPNA